MQRYTVTLVNDTGGGRPSTIVPFHADAPVASFKDEIIKRAIRQNIPVTAETHDLTLHLQSQTGPTLDSEDMLSDVIIGSETIFAVFSQRSGGISIPFRGLDTTSVTIPDSTAQDLATKSADSHAISVRVITPATAKQVRSSLQTFTIPVKATMEQLRERVAHHLELPLDFDKLPQLDECNCSFARKLSDYHSSVSTAFVIRDKSKVDALELNLNSSTDSVCLSLQAKYGAEVDTQKKVHYFGGEQDAEGRYTKFPVIALCSKSRHIPATARVPELPDESDQAWTSVLDLHTSEMPIHISAMPKTISQSGLLGLCNEGVLDVYAVRRNTTPVSNSVCSGKDGVFRNRAYWRPSIKQSDRGTAMFLSSLRVAVSLVQDMEDDSAAQDAFLHMFDILGSFPPALRTLYLLIQGKTPSPSECAALSHVCFHVLEAFMPEDLIGPTDQRLFEGSRLFFGFLLEKGRSVKLHESQLAGPHKWPYLSALQVSELRDSITNELVMEPVQTEAGAVERAYFDAFSATGILSSNLMQPALSEGHMESTTFRRAMLSGGASAEVLAFDLNSLTANYIYTDGGNAQKVIDESELQELQYLASLLDATNWLCTGQVSSPPPSTPV
jgi:hypothetical protein